MAILLERLKTLHEITAGDEAEVGAKVFNCARLAQAGFSVPDGVVIPASATEVDIDAALEDMWFGGLPEATCFAVRSSGIGEDSAGHSFAGIHETLLNVRRDGLREAVSICRRSAQSNQALAYRRVSHLEDQDIRIAVFVQCMVVALTSGVAFTVDPVTGADELVVNSTFGVGEALVSGQVEPDEFRLRKRDGALVWSRLGTKGDHGVSVASLSPAHLEELAELLVRIERYFGAPQDVEWCHDGRQFWIVQSRPVTTRAVSTALEIEWTRANLAEVFPDQLSPQATAEYEVMLDRAERQFMGNLLAPTPVLGPVMKAFHGRMYLNLSQMRRVCQMGGAPPADLMRSMGHIEEIRPEDEIVARPPFRDWLRCLPDFARILVNDLRAERLLRRHEAGVEDYLARLSASDPRTLSDRDVWEAIDSWRRVAPENVQIVFVVGGVLFRETSLRKACEQVGFSYQQLLYAQLATGKRSVSTQQALDLVALAEVARRDPKASRSLLEDDGTFVGFRDALKETQFLEGFERFLKLYGHRGRYESDWALPRYHEDPTPLLFAIRAHLEGPPLDLEATARRQAIDAATVWRVFEDRLTTWQRLTLLPRVRAIVRRLKRQYVWREQVRSDLLRVLSELRTWHLTLAQRFFDRGWIDRSEDYFLLRLEEIASVVGDGKTGPGLSQVAGRRAAELEEQRHLRMPMLMRESELPRLLRTPQMLRLNENILTGLCVSPGCVEGEVVVMRDPAEFARMKRGAILVAPATDPSWTPLFTLAAGVIVEIGGMLSHASTVAREYGLPALANVKGATTELRDGEWVQLDATAGQVRRGANRPAMPNASRQPHSTS